MCRRREHPRSTSERGAASVFALSLVCVILLLGMASVFVTATASAHRTAQSGADLAALAGAATLQSGGDPCAAAGANAGANGVVLVGCLVEGEDVLVRVEVAGPEFLGHSFTTRGNARAGPG
ncbi:MAG TPA: Rv3654c family TadE-like protein [Nocardioides sp.]